MAWQSFFGGEILPWSLLTCFGRYLLVLGTYLTSHGLSRPPCKPTRATLQGSSPSILAPCFPRGCLLPRRRRRRRAPARQFPHDPRPKSPVTARAAFTGQTDRPAIALRDQRSASVRPFLSVAAMVDDPARFHASVRGARPAPRRTRRGGRRRGSFLRIVAGGACKKKKYAANSCFNFRFG